MSEPPKPTLEERLEALAQSLELLYRDQQQDAANIRALALATQQNAANIGSLALAAQQDAANINTLARIAREALASVQSLERTATAHQQRLDEHDNRIRRLEDEQ